MYCEQRPEDRTQILFQLSRSHGLLKFPQRDVDELLNNLIADHTFSSAYSRFNQLCCAFGLCRRASVKGIDEDVRIEKESSFHLSFISSRVKVLPARTWRNRRISDLTSFALPACDVNWTSHSRKAWFKVLRWLRATSLACSTRSSSALKVMFFMRIVYTNFVYSYEQSHFFDAKH